MPILQSIKPQYCELIASGKKTREVRKTRPKIELPVKVYICCTKSKKHFTHGGIVDSLDDLYRMPNGEIRYGYSGELMCCHEPYTADNFLNGKVIGEYVCDEITKYTTEFHPSDKLFQGIWEQIIDEESGDEYGNIVTGNDFDNPDNCDICKRSCLSFDDIRNYVGYGDCEFYAWHISKLKIYDKPKELSEFYKECTEKVEKCKHCKQMDKTPNIGCDGLKPLTRPPQSWCYVEEV